MGTPTEDLANVIIERLISEKIVSENDAAKLLPNLVAGNLRPEDWSLMIESQLQREEQE